MGNRRRSAVGCLRCAADASDAGAAADGRLARGKHAHVDAVRTAHRFASAKGYQANAVGFSYGGCLGAHAAALCNAAAYGNAYAAHRHAVPHCYGEAPHGHAAAHCDAPSPDGDTPTDGTANAHSDAGAAYAHARSRGHCGAAHGDPSAAHGDLAAAYGDPSAAYAHAHRCGLQLQPQCFL